MNKPNSEHVVVDMEEDEETLEAGGRNQDHFDEDLLHRAVEDAGRWAYGCVAVEIWVLNKSQTQLYRPEGGWWVDPIWHRCENKKECLLCRLTDPSVPGYEPPPPVSPGVGLAGVLWSDSLSRGIRLSLASERRFVVWRDFKALQQDPDQPHNSRVKRIGETGMGYAGGVYFNNNGHQGIVVFVARQGVDLHKLTSETNESYMYSAANLIGSAWALRGPRRIQEAERKKDLDAALRRARIKLQAMIRMGISLSNIAEAAPPPEPAHRNMSDEFRDRVYQPSITKAGYLKKRLMATIRKCKGAGVAPNPPFTWTQSLWTFVGVFATLLILSRMNTYIDDSYDMELGPFGALMTLQYGLTAAPASQPPNAILGQALSLAIAIGIASIDGLHLWVRQSLATALAVTSMVKLGVTHPPAGAAALIFAGGNNSWGNLAMMLVGNCIAIGTSTLINNLNSMRQYPMFWGFGWMYIESKRRMARLKQGKGE